MSSDPNLPAAFFPQASPIGFGCASLGSRISGRHGQRMIARALDAGINWFDVAPAYGDGRAETLLGQALARRSRESIHICTKVGIAPRQVGPVLRAAKPVIRGLLKGVPRLRERLARQRPAIRTPVRPEQIETSLIASLKTLKTDYVDLLLLHDPAPEDAADMEKWDEVLAELEHVKSRGLVRLIGLTGPLARTTDQSAAVSRLDHLQAALSLHANPACRMKSSFALHSVGRVAGQLADLAATDAAVASKLCEQAGSRNIAQAARAVAMEYALAEGAVRGRVLLSMFSDRHLDAAMAGVQRFLTAPKAQDGYPEGLHETLAYLRDRDRDRDQHQHSGD